VSGEEEAQKALLKLIEDGVSASADSLAKVSHTNWSTQSISINTDTIEKLTARLERDAAEHYGAFAGMSGAVFLLMFPKQSGPDLSAAFLSGRKPRPGAPPLHEGVCVAEISNIVIHAVANTLADACDMAFILSAPEMVVGTKSSLLKLAVNKLKTAGEKYAIMTYVHMSSAELTSDCTVLLFLSQACRGTMLKALDR
jgi:hypothetical protein